MPKGYQFVNPMLCFAYLVSRLNSDVQVVEGAMSSNFSLLARCMLFIIVAIIVMMIINLKMTGISFAFILPNILFTMFYQRFMRVVQKTIQAAKGKMTTVAEESFSNIRTVKAFDNEDEELSKYQICDRIVFQAGRRKTLYTGISSMITTYILWLAWPAVIYFASKMY